MSLLPDIELQSFVDGYSYQVFTDADKRFWFRLVREEDRDIITDYSLGSFPVEQGGDLLARCYRTLGLAPKPRIVFRDILPGGDPSDTSALNQACARFKTAGQSLLAKYGFETTEQITKDFSGKVDLLLFGNKK